MKAFIYTENKHNVSDPKNNLFPLKLIIAIIFADSIIEADKEFDIQFEQKTGKPINKNMTIGCAPINLEFFVKYFPNFINNKSLEINNFHKQIKQLNYIIFGLENPWVKKEPDYSI